MTKCEYCGKEIGLLEVRYTWLDKKNDRAIHDKCLEEYKKNTEKEKHVEKKENTKDDSFHLTKSEETTEELGKELAEKILCQKDRLLILGTLFDNLPGELTYWFYNIRKNFLNQPTAVEIDLQRFINLEANYLPGDLIIRSNRDPKVGDLAEIISRDANGYFDSIVKIKKISIKDGLVFVYNPLNLEQQGSIGFTNIVGIIEKIVKYEDSEWEKIIKILNIEYENDEIIKWIEDNIEHINKTENFFEKENTLKKLEERLKTIKEHNKNNS